MRDPAKESPTRILNRSRPIRNMKVMIENLSAMEQEFPSTKRSFSGRSLTSSKQESNGKSIDKVRINGVSERQGSYQHMLKTLSQLSKPDDGTD